MAKLPPALKVCVAGVCGGKLSVWTARNCADTLSGPCTFARAQIGSVPLQAPPQLPNTWPGEALAAQLALAPCVTGLGVQVTLPPAGGEKGDR